jgi:hypothetical protein
MPCELRDGAAHARSSVDRGSPRRRASDRPHALEPEGITFIGATYAEVRHGVVLLDPQGERIEPDRIVSLNENGELLLDWFDHVVAEPTSGSPTNGAAQRRLVAA